jgi:hypothetical protein
MGAVLRLAFIADIAYTYWLDLSRDKMSMGGVWPICQR